MNLLPYFRKGYRRIKQFLVWIPILRKNKDWDYVYLFEILRFKISRIRQDIEKNQRHLNYEKNMRDMKVVKDTLARMGFSDFYWHLSQQLENEEKKKHCHCPKEICGIKPESFNSKPKKPTLYRMINLPCSYYPKNRNR